MPRREWISLVSVTGVIALTACGGGGQSTQQAPAADTSQPAMAAPSQPAAQPTANVQLPEGVTAEMVAAGDALFHGKGNCHTCHGEDAKGTPLAPNLTDTEWLNIDGSYPSIVQTVHTGVPSPKQHPAAMPPMGGAQLTDQEINQVAAYVYSLSHGG